ncbi:ABC transporter ATP-binding protein [Gordonia sp. NPDC058843]|uniref:ABC transporter ATP-binding protein n=1 Tax=Gordonia sp. NPDC058843 TaxID=3346648 RepID=UPI0036C84502
MTGHLVEGRALEVRGLVAAYRRRGAPVLRGVDVDVRRGEVVGVLGPNGCGKSTLVKSVCGVLTPRAGTVVADGVDVMRLRPSRRAGMLGYVPQQEFSTGALTVADSLSLGLDRRTLGAAAVADVVLGVASRLDLSDLLLRRVVELSGGQRQRVLIGRSLAIGTPYLLLDEPVSSLDLRYQLEIMQTAGDLARAEGVGVLVVLHDLNLAAAFCDRVVVLDRGRVHAEGATREVVTEALVHELYGPVADVVELRGERFVLPRTEGYRRV